MHCTLFIKYVLSSASIVPLCTLEIRPEKPNKLRPSAMGLDRFVTTLRYFAGGLTTDSLSNEMLLEMF